MINRQYCNGCVQTDNSVLYIIYSRIYQLYRSHTLCQRPSVIEGITKSRLMWASHAWRKEGLLLRMVLENAPLGKRPLGGSRLRWEDGVKKGVEKERPRMDWRESSMDRENWMQICWTTLVLMAEVTKEGRKKKNIFVTFLLTNSTAAPLDTVYIKYFRQLKKKLTKAAHSKGHRL